MGEENGEFPNLKPEEQKLAQLPRLTAEDIEAATPDDLSIAIDSEVMRWRAIGFPMPAELPWNLPDQFMQLWGVTQLLIEKGILTDEEVVKVKGVQWINWLYKIYDQNEEEFKKAKMRMLIGQPPAPLLGPDGQPIVP